MNQLHLVQSRLHPLRLRFIRGCSISLLSKRIGRFVLQEANTMTVYVTRATYVLIGLLSQITLLSMFATR
jgi:hypothetical protein